MFIKDQSKSELEDKCNLTIYIMAKEGTKKEPSVIKRFPIVCSWNKSLGSQKWLQNYINSFGLLAAD